MASSKRKTTTPNSTATETRPADAPAVSGAGAAGAAAPVAPATLHIAPGATPMTAETGAAIVSAATAAAEAMNDPPRDLPKPSLVVTALADRRRRHGIDFGRAETVLDPETIGEDGLRALVADPMLKVEIVPGTGERVRLKDFPSPAEFQAARAMLAGKGAGDG